MANPGDFAYTVKEQADIVRIVGEYVKLRKSGAQNFQGLCPFHSEKTPSFSVHATRQFFHCFGCGTSGDVFAFVQKIENITFPEAVRLIAEKLKIPLPKMTLLLAGRGADCQAARRAHRHPRARLRVLSGAAATTGRRACARISGVARTDAGADCRVSHWLCAGPRLPAARCAARSVRRRAAAGVGTVFVERKESGARG